LRWPPQPRRFPPCLRPGFVQRGAGLLEGDAGAAAVDTLAGETRGGHFDVGGQQHHVGGGDGLGGQRVARADRALGFDGEL
jgi:hypothetical protein